MALFVASTLSAQTATSCNPANCKKTSQCTTSGNALINLMTAISNGTYVNQVSSSEETAAKKPNCDPKACSKAKNGEARLVATSVEERKSYTINPASVASKKSSLICDPVLCEKICAGIPNCSPNDCGKVCAKKVDDSGIKGTIKL